VDRKIVEMFRDGKSASAITKILDKSKGYVIKVRDLAEQYGFIEKISDDPLIFRATERVLPQFPEILFPIEDLRKSKPAETDQILAPQIEWIKERLDLGWSPQTIFEELKVSVPRSNFYRYLERQHLQADRLLRSSPEIVHAPGECLQVDWAKLFDIKDPSGKSKTVWAFIGILGHSRYTMVRVMQKCDFAATVTALTSMFDELGGTPKRVTSDNPKVFVNLASKHEPLLNAGYERFSSYYGFTIEALPPSDPQKKGKVERTVQLVRRLFESFDQNQFTMEYAQAHADLKLSLANQRKHGTHGQRPASVFESEKLQLKALPLVPYELETIIFSDVRKDGYVRFFNKYYRIDQRLKGQVATVIGNSKKVSIYVAGRLLETYERITDPFKSKDCKEHYKESWEKTMNDHGHYIRQAEAIGENVSRFIQVILARGEGFVDTRVVWGILTLIKKYPAKDIDQACASALELSQVNLRTVKALLNLCPKRKDNEEFKTTGGKFARPMSEYTAHLRLVPSSKP